MSRAIPKGLSIWRLGAINAVVAGKIYHIKSMIIIFKEELYLVHIVIYILTPALEALELFVPWFGDKFIQLIKLFIVLWCVCEILTRSGFMIYELFQFNSHMLYLNRKR